MADGPDLPCLDSRSETIIAADALIDIEVFTIKPKPQCTHSHSTAPWTKFRPLMVATCEFSKLHLKVKVQRHVCSALDVAALA